MVHTSFPQEVLYGTVLELGAVVGEECFWATESEENLPIQFAYTTAFALALRIGEASAYLEKRS